MENFEYSIQLNDRDWAEFYLASEECSLIQAALATAEEPLPNDLEDGEVKENRLIRVRVGPGPAPSTADCLPRDAPCRHLLGEEALPGGQPPAIQGSQPSRVASELSGGQHELPKCARECDASTATKGRESETGDRLTDFDCSLPAVVVAVQKAEFRGQAPGQGAMEKPVCSVLMRESASNGTDGEAGEPGSRPLGSALQEPTNDISQTASADVELPILEGSDGACGSPEKLRNLSAHPTPSSFPSGESEGAEHRETEPFQVNVQAEAPQFWEEVSPFQGHSAPPVGALAPSDPRSESHEGGLLESRSHEGGNAADLKDEGRADQSGDSVPSFLKEEGPVGQEISSAGCKASLQKLPEELEASECSHTTIPTSSRCWGTLELHRETAVLKAETQKVGIGEPCRHLGPVVPFEGETPSMAQGSQRSICSEGNTLCGRALENPLEGNSAEMTQPQEYEHFISGNTPEQAKKRQGGAAENRLASAVGQDLPEMNGPEMYEYFFTDMEGAWQGNSGGQNEMGLEIPGSPDQPSAPSTSSQDLVSIAADDATHISVPEVYEHFFNNGAQDRKSRKRLLLSMPASEAKKAVRALKSLLRKPALLLRCDPPSPGTPLRRGSHEKLLVFSPRLLEESQPRPEDLRMAVMAPERPLQLAFTHRDVCLGFVAFASWAVKTSNLQGPDAWKIVLLANFGTFSAIRYFRRQIVAEGEHGT